MPKVEYVQIAANFKCVGAGGHHTKYCIDGEHVLVSDHPWSKHTGKKEILYKLKCNCRRGAT